MLGTKVFPTQPNWLQLFHNKESATLSNILCNFHGNLDSNIANDQPVSIHVQLPKSYLHMIPMTVPTIFQELLWSCIPNHDSVRYQVSNKEMR